MDTNNKGLVLKTPIGTPLSIVYHAEDRYLFIRNLNGSDSGRVVLNREDLPALIDYLVDIGFVERPEQLAPVVPESVRDMLDDALHDIAVGLDRAEANGEKWYTDHAEWHRSRWQDAKNWLDSLPVQAEPQATVDVPERVRQNMDVLYGHICANTYRDSPVRLAADMVYGYLNGAWSTPDREWLPPWAPTPEQWARIPEEYICAAVDADGRRYRYKRRPRAMNMAWFNFEAEYIDTIDLNGVDWQDTLTWRPGHEPKDTDS